MTGLLRGPAARIKIKHWRGLPAKMLVKPRTY